MKNFVRQLTYLICSTVYVKNSEDKFLLIYHQKLKRWVPPGGKLEHSELPHEAAIRECLEETGVKITLISAEPRIKTEIHTPISIEFNNEGTRCLSHLDFIYFATPIFSSQIIVNHSEAEDVKWLTVDEIGKLDTFSSVYYWCNKFNSGDYDCY